MKMLKIKTSIENYKLFIINNDILSFSIISNGVYSFVLVIALVFEV